MPRYTKHGHVVPVRTVDHLPTGHPVSRFNSWLAISITKVVGTMWCAYAFAAIALTSLPSTLHEHSVTADVSWVAQTFLQLVLLAVIIVGQNIQTAASDIRAAKTFDDTEEILDRLDLETEGGLQTVLDSVNAIKAKLNA